MDLFLKPPQGMVLMQYLKSGCVGLENHSKISRLVYCRDFSVPLRWLEPHALRV